MSINLGIQAHSPYDGNFTSFSTSQKNNGIIQDEFSDFFNSGTSSNFLGAPKKKQAQKRCNDSSLSPFDNIDRDYKRRANTPKVGLNFGDEFDAAFGGPSFKSTSDFQMFQAPKVNFNYEDELTMAFGIISNKPTNLPLYQQPKQLNSLVTLSLKRKAEEIEIKDYSSDPASSEDACNSDSDFPVERKISYAMPMTPCKKIKKARSNPFEEKALKILDTDKRHLYTNGQVIEFRIDPSLKKTGRYVQFTKLASDQPQLYDNYTNDQVANKCYNLEMVRNRPNDLEGFMKSSLKQYNELLSIGFPISKILNADTALNDGFFNVKNIEHEFPINWDADTAFEFLDKETMHYLDQVKAMFQYAFDNEVELDLSAANLRINNEGKVFLCDFREEFQGTFDELIDKHIKTFANYNDSVRKYLRPTGYFRESYFI